VITLEMEKWEKFFLRCFMFGLLFSSCLDIILFMRLYPNIELILRWKDVLIFLFATICVISIIMAYIEHEEG
jgi:hypothetical protein